jgi:hypothetical protein
MQLGDQAILDANQDEILRLPTDERIFLSPLPLDVNPIRKDKTMTPRSDFNPKTLAPYEQEVPRLLKEIRARVTEIA